MAALALGMIGCSDPSVSNDPVFTPVTIVKITGCSTGDFYISNTELTYAKWYEVYQWAVSNGYVFQDLGREGKSEKATVKADTDGYRLPTEVEWEYAAKGGADYTYSGSNNIDDVAWYSGNSSDGTKDVGTKDANGYELHDMSGNVNMLPGHLVGFVATRLPWRWLRQFCSPLRCF